MKRVKITFYIEPTDDDNSTGLTDEDFVVWCDRIAGAGGEDYSFELEEYHDGD
jgi:hypothetical protein